jgi:dipeptidyl-peptidase-4
VMLKEMNKYYIDITDDMTFLEDGKCFIWTSEKDGFNHIYMYELDGKLKRQLTKGNFDVTRFYGVDEKRKTIYYQAAEESPLERQSYSISFKGKKKKKITPEIGTNRTQWSSNFDYFVNTHSTLNSPATYTVYENSGKEIRVIEDNAAMRTTQQNYSWNNFEFFNVPIEGGEKLNGWMLKPADFDPDKKYPVFMYVYGGPGSQTVTDSWGGFNNWWYQMLAQNGYIVVSVDNRGSGARGQEFKKITYLELGKYETMDQISAAKYLGNQSYIDAERIGIFGWSYGGYMSSLCLFKGADVFKSAIAVAPVTNWKWYDTIYTERYMRTEKENESGYKDNSPVNFTDLMKGKYLLVHGVADDNVHFQNTAEMVNALIRSNKQFDTYFYPNRNHGIFGGTTRLHLYNKMTDFIYENL